MNKPLAYLREILSNYTEHSDIAREIDAIIRKYDFESEESFVKKLSQEQMDFLDQILPGEIRHAMRGRDYVRAYQLNEVYEQIY